MYFNKQEMNERVARAMGWWNADGLWMTSKDDSSGYVRVPDFTDPTTFFKYVVPFARERGYDYDFGTAKENQHYGNFHSGPDKNGFALHEDFGTAGVMAFLKAMEAEDE